VDHRLVDGYDAARFVAEIKDSLESPGLLFLESV
jgi:pyruvate/2-oxoglutarate dehydrogenase complex dihydrolipoamide acyltransferase (E2) component